MSDTSKFRQGDKEYGMKDLFARQELEKKVPIPEKAKVGQTIVVTKVDENGYPLEWEAAAAGLSLPLRFEATMTEEVRMIDTGNQAFTDCKSMLIVQLHSVKTDTNSGLETKISASAHTPADRPSTPYGNMLLARELENGMVSDYDRYVMLYAIRGEDGYWTTFSSVRTTVNTSAQNVMVKIFHGSEPINGIVIGDAFAAEKGKRFGVGTTLRIWGV